MTAPRVGLVRPEGLPPAAGFSHGAIAAEGRALYVSGQIGAGPGGDLVASDFEGQFSRALDNVLAVVEAAGGRPDDVARMTVYVTEMDAYRRSRARLGPIWRARMGRHFPAMALVAVAELVDPGALVEIEAVAALPGEGS